MTNRDTLTERERQVLEAVIRTYVETAEPAGSRAIAKRSGLGVSTATVRNTMADLEEKGYLFHPRTSAGRIPTDLAYRYYVDTLMKPRPLSAAARQRLKREIAGGDDGPPVLEQLIRRSAEALGVLTGELGIAIAPRVEEAVLEKLELVAASSDKVLLVLTLRGGMVRTIYVDLAYSIPPETLVSITLALNERLSGLTLSEIRATLTERMRDASVGTDSSSREFLNIFIQSADDIFEWKEYRSDSVHLGRTSVLANQPEFSTGMRLKALIELTEQREFLASVLGERRHQTSLTITIGGENEQPELSEFTIVTSEYTMGNLSGVIGVIGPTRMPYERVVAIVGGASALMQGLLESSDDVAR